MGVLALAGISMVAGQTQNTLPKDVYPDSRNRLPLAKRDQLDDEGKKAYDVAVANPRSLAGLQGPAGIRLYSPKSGGGNQYLRYDTALGRRLSELAILVTAREMDQQFEWTAHEPEARKQGLEQSIIDVVKYRKPLTGIGEKETAIIELGREVFGKHKVSPETFTRAKSIFGSKTIVDLAALMGDYASTATLLTTFDQQIPADQKPLLPMP
jgi:4-carboxymuconolactone decarboxylase